MATYWESTATNLGRSLWTNDAATSTAYYTTIHVYSSATPERAPVWVGWSHKTKKYWYYGETLKLRATPELPPLALRTREHRAYLARPWTKPRRVRRRWRKPKALLRRRDGDSCSNR